MRAPSKNPMQLTQIRTTSGVVTENSKIYTTVICTRTHTHTERERLKIETESRRQRE